MLQTMHIQNIALIDDIEVNFEQGLNILSGETGAGKSIIIGSIAIALGQKFTKELLRDPEKQGLIELVFSLKETDDVMNILKELDIPVEDGELIVTKKCLSGKTTTRVNGTTITQTDLKQITSCLLDLHGQHEHQSLLKKSKHMALLDAYGKGEVAKQKEVVANLYHTYKNTNEELLGMTMDEELRLREISFCEFELNEIDLIDPKPGEEDDLMAEYKKASHAKQIVDGLSQIYDLLEESKASATVSVGQAIRAISSIVSYDDSLNDIQSSLYDLESVLNDLCREVSVKIKDTDVDEEHLFEVQKRLDVLHDLKRKYGNTIEDILNHREKTEQKLLRLRHYEEHKNELTKKLAEAESLLTKESEKLSKLRKNYAKTLEKLLEDNLKELNFLQVQFEIHVERTKEYSANGFDDVCFYISTNPGSPVRPLQEVASGGELSRIMLAIKAIMADTEDVDTLIFDEIDTGISGRTALKVASLLSNIATSRQVICISHLPQIVSMADTHFLIEKSVEAGFTRTDIYHLDDAKSIMEIARLLGGLDINALVLENARQMKKNAKKGQ